MGLEKNNELPDSWIVTTIETIRLDLHEGISPNKFPEKKFELYSVPQFDFRKPELAYGKDIGSNKQIIKGNTVLLCKINPRINRVWITDDFYPVTKICSTEWIPFFQIDGLDPKYLSYFLQNPNFRAFLLINVSGVGGSLTRTKPSSFKDYPFPLPSLPEQKEIVDRIEAFFSELDSGIESLKKAREQLKTYRQAVLKHAFEGRLTEKWRQRQKEAGNPPEPAEKLIERIGKEREAHYKKQLEAWEKECEQAKAEGRKKPAKPKKPKDLPQLTEDELAGLPELPEGWGWAKIDRLLAFDQNALKAGPFGSSLKKDSYTKYGYKIYGQEQVIRNDPEYGDYFISENKYQELISCKVSPRDILVSLVGTIGKVLVLPEEIKQGIINPRLIKISLNKNVMLPEFFKFYFESAFLKNLYKLKTHGATMNILNLGIIKDLPFPVCPTAEQNQIVSEIESRLSVCDQLEQNIEDSLHKAETLRQSILKKAFSGELTRQWRKENPELISGENSAEKLIERIREEKKKVQGAAGTRRGKKKTA